VVIVFLPVCPVSGRLNAISPVLQDLEQLRTRLAMTAWRGISFCRIVERIGTRDGVMKNMQACGPQYAHRISQTIETHQLRHVVQY
jgi:hypothetical protein